jgi:hypothetical protein
MRFLWLGVLVLGGVGAYLALREGGGGLGDPFVWSSKGKRRVCVDVESGVTVPDRYCRTPDRPSIRWNYRRW